MTGAALQALAVVGGRRAARHSGRSPGSCRNQGSDGGFAQMAGRSPNAQSTAYAVQGLLAVGAARPVVNRALSYLVRLQRRDGSIAYSATSSQTPVWVTGQALAALERAPLPIAPVARAEPPNAQAGARRRAARGEPEAAPSKAEPKAEQAKTQRVRPVARLSAPPRIRSPTRPTSDLEDPGEPRSATGKPASTLRLDPERATAEASRSGP